MKVAILGCGPSGLVAAHAAWFSVSTVAGSVDIYSIKNKSPIFGAQYLHKPIPYVTKDDPRTIFYKLNSDPARYLRKVYGDAWDGLVSDEMRTQAFLAWDLRATYAYLWETYKDMIRDTPVTETLLRMLGERYDLVVNTVPRPELCMDRISHKFKSTKIWAAGDTNEGGCPIRGTEDVINYNGLDDPSWYRVSRMFGYSTAEWPGWMTQPPFDNVVRVSKPLGHNCTCWPNIHHLGRMGRWQNGELVDQVWPNMAELVTLKLEKVI